MPDELNDFSVANIKAAVEKHDKMMYDCVKMFVAALAAIAEINTINSLDTDDVRLMKTHTLDAIRITLKSVEKRVNE